MQKLSWARPIVFGLALAAGTALFAKTTRISFGYLFPGVNGAGNLSEELGAEGGVTATYNDKKGTLRVIGRAVVQNQSNLAQTYNNVGVLPDVGGEVITDRYKVSKKGKAAYTGLVVGATGLPE